MRIRKNTKLSPLLFSFSSSSQDGSFPIQTHVCQLNQSPWDVIPFDSHSIQFEGEDSFTAGNGAEGSSAGDSIAAIESVASMPRMEDMVMVDNNHKMKIDDKCDKKKNIDNHLSIVRSDNCKEAVVAAAAAVTRARRGARARGGKKTRSSSSSNLYEFYYYYSGFGPQWSKRRGGYRNGGEGSKNSNKATVEENSAMMESENINTTTTTPSSDNAQSVVMMDENEEKFDNVDDNEEEEDDANDDDGGKRRMRKPVKARSLKSLM